LNIQTERLENHTARITVEVDAAQLEQAKQKAATKLSKRVNIPGFRKGKVPYRILLNYVGEAAILEESVELLGNQIYPEALGQSDLEPYGPGVLEDFKIDPAPQFSFVLPLAPTVDLGDYRAVRVDYEVKDVTDDDVERALKSIQEQHAVVEESHETVSLGNRLVIDIHSHYVGEAKADAAESEEDAEEPADEEAPEHTHEDDEEFVHQHDMPVLLEELSEPMPGFSEALVGAVVGEQREFELTFPDDEEKFDSDAGRTVKFNVVVKKIESVTLPELNDDLAARVTASEETPLTLLELRVRVRENLQRMQDDRLRSDYAQRSLDKMVEAATIAYPEAMVADQVDMFLNQLDQNLRQQGLTLEDYKTIYKKSNDDLYADYRESSARTVERQLVLREIMLAEGIMISEQSIDAEIERVLEQFDEARRDGVRQLFNEQSMRDSVRNDLVRDRVLDRIVAIAKGEALEPASSGLPEPDAEAAEVEASADVEESESDEDVQLEVSEEESTSSSEEDQDKGESA
jgi:trigger factor